MDIVTTLYGRQERSWQIQANCMGVDPDLFFPERGASTREAKEVCRGCVVREDCLEYALANGEKFGIWGGMSERERRRVRRARALQRRDNGARRQRLHREGQPRPADLRLQAERVRAGLDVARPEVRVRSSVRRERIEDRPGSEAHQFGPVHGAPRLGDQSDHSVIELAGPTAAGSIRLHDTWARSPTRRPSARTAGPPDERATGRATVVRGDPDVVGHQDRPGAHGRGSGRAMGALRTEIGRDSVEGMAPELG